MQRAHLRHRSECANAFLEKTVILAQVDTQIVNLDTTTQHSFHLEICQHPPSDGANLVSRCQPHSDAFTENLHMICTLLELIPAHRLGFHNVAAKVSVCKDLGTVRGT